MVWWRDGLVARWLVARWFGGEMVCWQDGLVARWFAGKMVWWYDGFVAR